jgi:hypothetical protein
MSGSFDIYNDGSNMYSLAQINIVGVKLKQGLIAYGFPEQFSLLGTDGNTYNFTNNIQMPTPPPSPNPYNNGGNFVPNNYPNFNDVIQYSNLTPATPTSNTVNYNTTTIILIVSSIVLTGYYYKTKYL